jgi:geranylgeranyl diphosphate synthase, type II
MSFREYLAAQQQLIDRELERLVPSENVPPHTIHRAMRYSLFAGGKRVRPILCMEAARAVGGAAEGIQTAACALELVHTYSLVHDDLPALDNDDYRRGKLTSHKVFGEAMAILTGDALLTLAFETLASMNSVTDGRKTRIIAELATAAGTVGGMIGGQVSDLEGEGKPPDAELLESIHRAKTGALLRASVRVGAIYAGADDRQLDALSRYGEHIGLAFQIMDDILDVEQSSESLGKTAGKDAQQHKITFPAVYGLDESRRMAERECVSAHQAVAILGTRGDRLRELADLIVQRKS